MAVVVVPVVVVMLVVVMLVAVAAMIVAVVVTMIMAMVMAVVVTVIMAVGSACGRGEHAAQGQSSHSNQGVEERLHRNLLRIFDSQGAEQHAAATEGIKSSDCARKCRN